ncbi:MAG: phospholipase D family protein [Rhodocyclaceae bacterium]|nr:MAG: phospholipase D family protein [Rhodocyclaceae bacterium]
MAVLCLGALAQAAPMAATGTVEVAFSPWDDAEGLVLRTLKSARHSLLVQAYVLTSRNIANALLEAKQRGVVVQLLADREQMERNENSLVPQLASAGVTVRLETKYSAAHNKVLVIDAEGDHPVVVTGSYNFSWSAQARNAENLLVLRDNPKLALAYRDNWLRHWGEAEPYDGTLAPVEVKAGGETEKRRANRDGLSPCAYLSPQERRLLGSECRRN